MAETNLKSELNLAIQSAKSGAAAAIAKATQDRDTKVAAAKAEAAKAEARLNSLKAQVRI